MNIAHQLLDGNFVLKTYKKKLLAKLPEFKDIKNVEVVEHKSQIWETTYHVVVEYKITYITKDGGEKIESVFCSAHCSEPRKNVYDSLKFLWNSGFNDSPENTLLVPRPLFYSKYFRGTFYVGAQGNNLYHYIVNKEKSHIESITIKAAAWFAKLHSINTYGLKNFNKDNSRIQTVSPGMKKIFEKIQHSYPEYYERFKELYGKANKKEKEFLASTKERWLVHGDAHPENVINIDENKIAVIDFTDLSLSDFARDLGSFLQQLDFKVNNRIGDVLYTEKIKNLFLDSYLKSAKIEMTEDLEKRINYYYNWTALRTVAFFLTKHHPMADRAEQLLNSIK